ncbi:protein-L-isoaspartate O-methyltransferase family protein [Legionella sp. CNM-4043-24]|uniref:protein-L-isoaspartate O-methyltransferase family protein n=1 Tax=Legionella sp. CNM-4043-24 TaxID=3421646 RepID=UPI00403AA4AC
MTNQIARINMIKQQLRTGDVLNDRILELYSEIPRDEFVPESMRNFAWSDKQLPLAHDQRMLTPLEEGRILQSLNLQGHETVLEVGTGTGFFTALLSRLCKKVISIDYFADFTEAAKRRLEQQQCDNVELITGDGCRGWLDKAPYDVIVMTGAVDAITETHRLQILPGGKLCAIVGEAPVMQCLLMTLDHDGNWTEDVLFETCVPSLIDKLKRKEFIF